MPTLVERKADIIPFAQFFLDVLTLMNNTRALKLSEKSIEKLTQYNWPGNFHELESVLEAAFLKAMQDTQRLMIEPEHIELNLENAHVELSVGQKLDEVERKYILQTLYFVHQNRTKAAEILGISIRTLRNKINQYREEGFL
jgi:two-component system response regulator FlrC